MAAVDVTISGILFDKLNRTQQNVVLIGEAVLTGLSVGGGPVIPPPSGGQPPGGGQPPHPEFPIALPPGSWPPGGKPPEAPGGYPPSAEHPIVIPPPNWQPPGNGGFTPPPPGSTAPVGPPNQAVNPIVVPDYILVQYPGYGWIAVGKPVPPDQPSTPPA